MADTANILEVPINKTPDNGFKNEYVKAFVLLLQDSRAIRGDYDNQIDMIDELIDEAGDVSDTSDTPKKTNSQIIPLAVHKAMAKTRFPFFWLESDTLEPDELNVVSSAFYDLVERSDLVEVYENKSGGMKRVFEVGDTLLKYGINPKTKFPHFAEEDFTKFFPSEFATQMRTASGERSTRQGVVTFTFSWEQAVDIFDEFDFKTKATIGRIPNIEDLKKNAYTPEQITQMNEREVEVAVCIDLDKEVQLVMAGATAAVIDLKIGRDNKDKKKNYPWFKGKGKEAEAFYNLIHLKCITKSKGFTSMGFGHIFYKTALEERRNKNAGLVYMGHNVNAKQIITVGNLAATEWNKHSQIADQLIAKGRQGVIPISANRDQQVSLTTLSAPPLTEEFERITQVIDKDIIRWFNVDSNITDTQKTLGALELEEESQDLILRQIARNNTREIKFALELIINFLENDVKPNNAKKNIIGDKRKLKVANRLKTGEKVLDMSKEDAITLGELAEIFIEHDIGVRVQGETGVKSSDTLRRFRHEAAISKLAAFNSAHPAIPRLMKETLEISGINLTEEEAAATIGQTLNTPTPQGQPQPIDENAILSNENLV